MTDLKLIYADGRERPLTLPKEFHTRFVEFDGRRFERQKDGSYKEAGEAPHTTLHGGRAGKGTGKLTVKRGKK